MTKTYTYTETRQNLASVLSQAEKDGEVIISKRNGERFSLKKIVHDKSPLDVPGINVNLSVQQMLESIREGREMSPAERMETYKHR